MPPKSFTTCTTKKSSAAKKPRNPSPTTLRTSKQARRIIELMLNELREGMSNPSHATTEAWERLFGSKQSMVVNLQKLVQTLAVLPDAPVKDKPNRPHEAPIPMTHEEMAMLQAWLNDKN